MAMPRAALPLVVIAVLSLPGTRNFAAGEPTEQQAADALRRAVEFFSESVSCEGGYLWRYSADLARREGEGKAGRTTVWVQPPGTPSVGQACLRAFEWTGDAYLLAAARRSGSALIRGQLASGGWDYRIEFDPERRRRYAYRRGADGTLQAEPSGRNVSTLDDNTTQAALRFLMQLDRALEFKDPAIHEAARFGLDRLVAVQYPNGAWPQRFTEPPGAADFPSRRAGYPADWPREHPGNDYSGYYTFNDNTIADTIATLFDAADVYDEPKYRATACRAGDFILLAQMPEPQPAWAQQYNPQMHPAWARRFEPPAVTGGESQGVMRTLMHVYRRTGNRKYLQPLPRALDYLDRSKRPDGRLARFYELRTNRPLYFTRRYELTYDDADMPTHYAFVVGSSLDAIRTEYERLAAADPAELPVAGTSPAVRTVRVTPQLAQRTGAAIESLDRRGAWVESGRLSYHGDDDPTRQIIDCRTFVKNVQTLSQYIAATRSAVP